MTQLMTVADAARLIDTGASLCVAGDHASLERLPRGRWIGGTTPYFMADEGGIATRDHVFVNLLPQAHQVSLHHLPTEALDRLVADAPEHGYSLVIVPSGSAALRRFAQESAASEDAFLRPTVGWVSGMHLSELGQRQALVFDGTTGQAHADGAVVARVTLPAERDAQVEIINIFEGDAGDALRFEQTGFEVRSVLVNGERCSFAEYLQSRGNADGRLPLVGDYAGARINVSVQQVDAEGDRVVLYAPVFEGVEYQLARPVPDYVAAFRERVAGRSGEGLVFSCNCVLNFLYGGFEGQSLGDAPKGPVTFGEIGYQLLNQTLVLLRVV